MVVYPVFKIWNYCVVGRYYTLMLFAFLCGEPNRLVCRVVGKFADGAQPCSGMCCNPDRVLQPVPVLNKRIINSDDLA